MILHHFTCHRAADLISSQRWLRPQPQPLLGGLPGLWLSTHRTSGQGGNAALMARLGLTWHTTRRACWRPGVAHCDPLGARFDVEIDHRDPSVLSFTELGARFPGLAELFGRLPDAQPWRWWLSLEPLHPHHVQRRRAATRV